jgi:hypothetical protein
MSSKNKQGRGYAPGRSARGMRIAMVRAVRAGQAGTASAGDAVAAPPVAIDERAVIAGLSARVFRHDIAARDGVIRCWSYVTDGMRAVSQPELVFTLRIDGEADAAFPDDPIGLFGVLYQAAAPVTRGGVAELSGTRLFDHHLLYAPAQPLVGVTVPAGALAVVMITSDELRAVRQLGALRVLARLGKLYGHYPYPSWSERGRRGLSLQATFEASVLMRVPRATLPEMCVVSDTEAQRIELRVTRGGQASLRRLAELPGDAVLALLTGLDPEADACLSWEPGQTGPLGITPPDSETERIAGCFVMFLPDQPADGGLMLEDGYAMKLTTASWQALRDALMTGRDLDLPARADMALRLTWLDDVYVAADGQTLVAPSGWNLYRPDAADPDHDPDHDPDRATASRERVHLLEVRLLTAQADVATRAAPRDIAVFCREIQLTAERLFGKRDTKFELKVRIAATPAGHTLELSHRGEVTPGELKTFYEAVRALAKLPMRGGEVAFEVFLAVDPDAEPSHAAEPT